MRWTGTKHRGFALMQVMIVVALVTVMSLVMLSESALEAQTGHNAALAGQAECLAESGVNLAMYYLLNPWSAPGPQSSYWTGGTNISVGGTTGSIASVTVTPQARPDLSKPQEYVICSTAVAASAGGASLSRTITARVAVNQGVKIGTSGVMSRGSLTIGLNTTVVGDVTVDGTLKVLSFVAGKAAFRLLDPGSTGTILNGTILLQPSEQVPGPANPSLYSPTYAYADGAVYARTEFASATLGGGMGQTLAATAANPAGIYHHSGTLTLDDNAKVNGTLIVEGNVILAGTGIQLNAQSSATGGYPALITTGDIRTASGKTITINGSVWCAKTIKSNTAGTVGTTLTINGALLFGSAGGTVTADAGTVRVFWDGNRVVLPDMDTSLKRSVAVAYWNKP